MPTTVAEHLDHPTDPAGDAGQPRPRRRWTVLSALILLLLLVAGEEMIRRFTLPDYWHARTRFGQLYTQKVGDWAEAKLASRRPNADTPGQGDDKYKMLAVMTLPSAAGALAFLPWLWSLAALWFGRRLRWLYWLGLLLGTAYLILWAIYIEHVMSVVYMPNTDAEAWWPFMR